jgi:tRNA G18 (ribose-2'-O)-methylase SpoU
MTKVVLIAHNIRSLHNVGSIFRTAEGFGVSKIYLSGYTPSLDNGLPHVRAKIARELHKTALGAERMVPNEYVDDVEQLISKLKNDGFKIIGLEQDPRAIPLPNLRKGPTLTQIALLLGEEVNGIEPKLRDLCDELIEIPMRGEKESFNVAVATGIALYALYNKVD